MPPAKPVPYPGDQYINDYITKMGFIKKDANGNTIIGKDVTITDSVGNFITADNARVTKSHNNILNAKNVVIINASGCRVDGADHTNNFPPNTINGTSANYSCIDGDANWVEGYASKTTGFGNVNCGENGIIDGNTNRIGIKGQPNKCRNCSIRGNNCEIDGGSENHAIGSFIKINGSGITVIGNAIGKPAFTTPGVHIIN